MKRTCALLLTLLMCLSLCACGRDYESAKQSVRGYSYESVNAPMPAPMAKSAAYDMAELAYEDSGFGATAAYRPTQSQESESADAPEENPEKIIYSGDATVETTEFDKSIAALEEMIAREGGFIQSSSVNGSNYYDSSRGYTSNRSASYTLRVPSARFNALMSGLSDIGNVPYTHTYTENVTAEYYDVQARLTALKAQETRLLEMMELAETVEDVITIEDKLTDVRYHIDSFQSSLNNWDRRVAYSTLNITVKEVQVYTPETVTKITYGQRLTRAFRDSLSNTAEFFQDLLVFLVSALPTLVILAVLYFVFRPLLKKLREKGRQRRARRAAAKAARKAGKTIEDAKIEEPKA